MSAAFLCNKWTLLIFRELLFGSTNFNDISRGVPRMSRTLLSNRLKELVNIGLITRLEKQGTGQVDYVLTKPGKALESVVFSMASWGQEWLETEPSLENIDGSFLMWDIRRNVRIHEDLPNLFIAHFLLIDMPENKSEYWLIFEHGQVDLCYVDRGFKPDVHIEVSARELTKIWMGWEDFNAAVEDHRLKFKGPKKYTEIAEYWLGCSTLAHIKKREKHLLVAE
ncbi:MAG: ArsR family transcriptional regulator [Alteromonadaceae bacterium]|jgi:DNA-binding HxlR family transcriptional regulator|uniref:winged helix-turn-helix transcriptional regulator n=1 Tax=Paraglaciecola chathamensis TaxID=368405 RepID=UPI000C3E98B5|nr:helix-turn-helix domain-containing protein [Paraglaciecola agarilytica]MBN25902.1 ArsR family transcriptional regulator [Alteromonadaceae bacterium]|tara:strand:+ start:96998 stop:97669 length:672 start_codon:yes stop_codon:yes gene_type:complete